MCQNMNINAIQTHQVWDYRNNLIASKLQTVATRNYVSNNRLSNNFQDNLVLPAAYIFTI
jgi:hypothetical protein